MLIQLKEQCVELAAVGYCVSIILCYLSFTALGKNLVEFSEVQRFPLSELHANLNSVYRLPELPNEMMLRLSSFMTEKTISYQLTDIQQSDLTQSKQLHYFPNSNSIFIIMNGCRSTGTLKIQSRSLR